MLNYLIRLGMSFALLCIHFDSFSQSPVKGKDRLIKEGLITFKGNIEPQYFGKHDTLSLVFLNEITGYENKITTKIKQNGQYEVKFKVYHVVPNVKIYHKYFQHFFFAYPGDTVIMNFKSSSKTGLMPQFYGNRAKFNSMLYQFKQYVNSQNILAKTPVAYELAPKLNEKEYFEKINEIREFDHVLINRFKDSVGLSDDDYKFLLNDSKYQTAVNYLNYCFEHSPPSFTSVSKEHLSFIDSTIINNEYGLLSKNYGTFLRSYANAINNKSFEFPVLEGIKFLRQNDTTLSEYDKKLIDKYILDKGRITSSETMDYFEKFFKSDLFNDFNNSYATLKSFNYLDSTIPDGIGKKLIVTNYFYNNLMKTIVIDDGLLYKYSNIVNNKVIESIIFSKNSERDSTYKSLTLKKFNGQKLDVKGSALINTLINKYSGKAIFIDFWATWCIPCIEQMKASKPYKQEFKDIVYVYACSLSPEGRWKFTVNDLGVEGEHFYLSDEQFKYISVTYKFNVIPHYIAIDRKGNILDDNASGPVNGREFKNILNRLSASN